MISFGNKLVTFTENYLTKIKKKRANKNNNTPKKHPLIDWVGSFFWALAFVFILNQYFIQAYIIPSKSMINTLNVGDRVLVNKFIYGPEILPGFIKVNSLFLPNKNSVVIFENPEYLSRGTIFDIFSRFVFMVTLSIIDIDKDANGNPSHHFLIKRLVGSENEIIQFNKGDLYIKTISDNKFYKEEEYNKSLNIKSFANRSIEPSIYDIKEKEIRESIYTNQNSNSTTFYNDLYYNNETNYKFLSHISPSMVNYYQGYNKKRLGIYIPKGYYLPLGDNRDNSKDGRYFGVIHKNEILGKASFKFWPFNRISIIE